MADTLEPLFVDANAVEPAGIDIPHATPGGFLAQMLNADLARGVTASIIHLKPGATIPRHAHARGAEAHYVLEGDFINAGTTHGPGAYLTHAAGVPHGPHSSRGGAKVLTLMGGKLAGADPDFEVVEG